MSEEEKDAIEYFKEQVKETKELGKKYGFQKEIKNNDILLNYIDKLQKENEELTSKLSKAQCDIRQKDSDYSSLYIYAFTKGEDSMKAKIREIMEELLGE